MEKAIEIKRRAQRCIQNGDLDGALAEYEKLVQTEDSDPYNFVLLADLLFKRGDNDNAVQRYLSAVAAYEKASLYKNAIAVCKKMMRLSLAPAKVLERLASLHALDGLGTEAALYYMQYAETLVRDDDPIKAAEALRKAFEASPEEVKALERMAEAYTVAGDTEQAASAMAEAAYAHAQMGRMDAAARCRLRAEQIKSGAFRALESQRGPIAGLDRFEGPVSTSTTLESPPGLGEADDHAFDPEPAHDALDDAPVAPRKPEHEHDPAHAGPPRLPSLTHADETETVSGNGVIANAGSDARATVGDSDDSIERFPAGFGGTRPGMRFDAADETPEPEPAHADASSGIGEAFAQALAPAPGTDAADAPAFDVMPVEVEAPETSEVDDDAVADAFEPPPRSASPAPEPMPSPEIESPAESPKPSVADIERLLSRAQEHFRAGDREAAGRLLVEAAVAYERIGRFDNAASIFRSLARGPHSTPELLELWLANAERRGDRPEAAEVACELGDRAVNDGALEAAQRWFERACEFDPDNGVASRRLSRLSQLAADAGVDTGGHAAPAPVAAPEPVGAGAGAEPESGRVEMALGRAEAVTFDLGSLLAEFQRGIEAQLSGDAQSHYDLAMTYREMGLLDQAVDSFRLAAQDPSFASRAAEMIGRCLLEQGRFADAAHELDEALRSPHLPTEAALGLRYQLGLAHEAAGDARAALAEFERVFAAQANYSDVALKLRVLRQTLESS